MFRINFGEFTICKSRFRYCRELASDLRFSLHFECAAHQLFIYLWASDALVFHR